MSVGRNGADGGMVNTRGATGGAPAFSSVSCGQVKGRGNCVAACPRDRPPLGDSGYPRARSLTARTPSVVVAGWVERSETHHGHFRVARPRGGFRFAQPTLRAALPHATLARMAVSAAAIASGVPTCIH